MDAGGQGARDAGAAVNTNPAFRWLVTIGLVSYGLIHLVLGWICVQVALGGRGQASTEGALRDLVSQPFGNALMLVFAAGMLALVIWQVLEAVFGYRRLDRVKKLRRRLSAAFRALVYAGLGVSALTLALGGRVNDPNRQARSFTAVVMGLPFGQALVAAVGFVVIAVGVCEIVKGVRRKFVARDLSGGVPGWAKVLGSVGWCAKGIALALVGALLVWAAISFAPEQAAGVDGALKSLLNQPYGNVALTAMGLGFACFGAYCLVWAFNANHEEI